MVDDLFTKKEYDILKILEYIKRGNPVSYRNIVEESLLKITLIDGKNVIESKNTVLIFDRILRANPS
jgi:hypothetical protein